jgi:hypothetical protein
VVGGGVGGVLIDDAAERGNGLGVVGDLFVLQGDGVVEKGVVGGALEELLELGQAVGRGHRFSVGLPTWAF